jgi:DNA modification methylase
MFSTKNDAVLDPFLGSGTTVKSAILNERNSIGYETDSNLLTVITKKADNCNAKITADVQIIKQRETSF